MKAVAKDLARLPRALQVLLLVAFLGACAQLGLVPAKSFDQQVAYGYSTLASVRLSAVTALDAKSISVSDAKQVQALADQARAGLDAARGAWAAGDTKTALGRLQLANSVLNQLSVFLQKRSE